MHKIYLTTTFAILLLAAPKLALSQSPALSITQKFLSKIGKDTCIKRAKEALAKFNLTVRDEGKEYCLGNNTEYAAAIFCDQCGTEVNVNISIATNLPVGDAIRLRDQLLKHISGEASGGNGNANLWLDKNSFGVSEPVSIHFSGMSGDAKDWLAVIPASQPDNVRGSWKYTGGDKEGALIWQEGFPAGDYEARAYFKNSWTVERRLTFNVR